MTNYNFKKLFIKSCIR